MKLPSSCTNQKKTDKEDKERYRKLQIVNEETKEEIVNLTKKLKALEDQLEKQNEKLKKADGEYELIRSMIERRKEENVKLRLGEITLKDQKRSLENKIKEFTNQSASGTKTADHDKLLLFKEELEKERKELEQRIRYANLSRSQLKRFKREVEDKIADRIYEYCKKLDDSLRIINADVQKENKVTKEALEEAKSRGRPRKRRALPLIPVIGLGALGIAGMGGLSYEEYQRRSENYIIRETIRAHYKEFTSTTLLANKLHQTQDQQIGSIWQSLTTLTVHVDQSSEFLKNLKNEVIKVADYSVTNRIWLTFLADLQVQRLLIAVIAKNSQQIRLLSRN